jgi:hypothetical protein
MKSIRCNAPCGGQMKIVSFIERYQGDFIESAYRQSRCKKDDHLDIVARTQPR